jgi:hypothetical protein
MATGRLCSRSFCYYIVTLGIKPIPDNSQFWFRVQPIVRVSGHSSSKRTFLLGDPTNENGFYKLLFLPPKAPSRVRLHHTDKEQATGRPNVGEILTDFTGGDYRARAWGRTWPNIEDIDLSRV